MTRPCASLYKYTPGSRGNWATFSRMSMRLCLNNERLYLNYVTEMDTAGALRSRGVRAAASAKETDPAAGHAGAGAAGGRCFARPQGILLQSLASHEGTENRKLLLQE